MSAMNDNQPLQLKRLLPFFWVACAWVGLSTFYVWQTQGGRLALWTLGLAALSLFDLFAMTQAIRAVIQLVSKVDSSESAAWWVQVVAWGSLKLACLFVFGWVLLSAEGVPSSSLFMGLGTLLVVPLAGGLWWSQKEIRYA